MTKLEEKPNNRPPAPVLQSILPRSAAGGVSGGPGEKSQRLMGAWLYLLVHGLFSANGKTQYHSRETLNKNPLHLQSASEVERDLIYFLEQSCRGGGMGIMVPSL